MNSADTVKLSSGFGLNRSALGAWPFSDQINMTTSAMEVFFYRTSFQQWTLLYDIYTFRGNQGERDPVPVHMTTK